MSNSRQDGWRRPRVYGSQFVIAQREEWAMHSHDDAHELLWGTRGSLTARTDDGFFAVPAALGLFIPAAVAHQVTASSGTRFSCTYIEPELAERVGTILPGRTCAVAMPALLRATLLHLGEPGVPKGVRDRAEELAIALLQTVPLSSIDLPVPGDDRARRVAEALLSNPGDDSTLEQWGRRVGSSGRNLSRLFVLGTGLAFDDWRRLARMRVAMELLASGETVGAVSRMIGYSTPSAFVHAFRQEFGQTPGRFGVAAEDDLYAEHDLVA